MTYDPLLSRRSLLRHTFMAVTSPLLLQKSLLLPFFMDGAEGLTNSKNLPKKNHPSAIQEKRLEKTPPRTLSFYNPHTGETVKSVPFWDKKGVTDGLNALNHLFRDHRTNQTAPIDEKLFHLLYALRETLDIPAHKPFHLISGYRSLKTNAMLCAKSDGVAKKSQHTLGKAADIALPGICSVRDIQKAAKSLGLGGVGAYGQFVHVDTGRVRFW